MKPYCSILAIDQPTRTITFPLMRSLIVLAHPLKPSLSAHFTALAKTCLQGRGDDPRVIDLYADGFDPVLAADERAAYYKDTFADTAELQDVESLVLVFPTWWFGMPAILKGWIDRSFLPGVAYDHATDLSALKPRLTALRHVVVITTLGSPRWYDLLIARRPLRRALKWGLVKAVAPQARFHMLSLYKAENVAPDRVERFAKRITSKLESLT